MALAPIAEVARPGRSDLQQFSESAFHRWYSFVLGYSDQVVTQILNEFSVAEGKVVLDPFCGTGTTLIECAKKQIESIGIDANPFAVFAARTKGSFELDPHALKAAADRVESRYHRFVAEGREYDDEDTYSYLDDSGMLERGWISHEPLRLALTLREAIYSGRDGQFVNALMLALVADLPQKIGNMKFGPQIYRGPIKEDVDPIPLFRSRVAMMVKDLQLAPQERRHVKPKVFLGDARTCDQVLNNEGYKGKCIDFVICSPPYPTEHDYTRHTRLELAFMDNVSSKECLQKIKRSMIRSHTKGIYKDDKDQALVADIPCVERAAKRVEEATLGKTSGFERLYSTVVRSYFGGMRRHFKRVAKVLRKGGRAAYVVGDQAAYLQVPIQTAALLGQVAEREGLKVEDIQLWRNRWSTGASQYLAENILLLKKA